MYRITSRSHPSELERLFCEVAPAPGTTVYAEQWPQEAWYLALVEFNLKPSQGPRPVADEQYFLLRPKSGLAVAGEVCREHYCLGKREA